MLRERLPILNVSAVLSSMSSRLSVMRGRALHSGCSEQVRAHTAPVYKLVIGVDAPLRFRVGTRTGSATALLAPPNVTHALETQGRALGLFLEPGGALTPRAGHARELMLPSGALQRRLAGLARAHLDGQHDDAALIDASFACLRLGRSTERLDRRVGKVLAVLAEAPHLSLAELARSIHLSPERMRHLVVEQTGTSLRTLRLFQRTLLAVEQLMRGARLPAAAQRAGFADHAHLTRSFVRLFGRTPSSMPADAQLWSSWAERAPEHDALER